MAINKSDYPNKIRTNLYANKTFNIFYYDFTYESKRYRGVIDLSNKTSWNKRDKISVAEAELIKIKNEKREDLDISIKLDDFANKHFDTLAKSDWTRKKRNFYNTYLSKRIGNKYLVDIRQLHIKNLIVDLENMKVIAKYDPKTKEPVYKNLAPRTIKQTIEILNPIFKDAVANRLISFNPLDGVSIKVPKTKKIVSNASERLEKIWDAILELYSEDPFYMAFFSFSLQGRRTGEIINLKTEDISLSNNYYIIRDVKNGETQKMFLPEDIKRYLVEFMDPQNEYVFSSRFTGTKLTDITWQLNKIRKHLKDENFSLHYLRNVITSAMGEHGIEAIFQSGALGHTDLTTINKYSTLNYYKGSEVASSVIDKITKRQ